MGNLFSVTAKGTESIDHIVRCEEVTARQTYNTLNDLTSYLLVLDVRCSADFQKSHIDLARNAPNIAAMIEAGQESPFTTIVIYGKVMSESILETFCQQLSEYRLRDHAGPCKVMYMKDYVSFQVAYPFQCSDSSMFEEGRLYPSQITDTIFLSNFGVASSRKVLQRLGITHVLNCTKDCPFAGEVVDSADSVQELTAAIKSNKEIENSNLDPIEPLPSLSCLRIPVIDEKDQQIHEHFEDAIEFLSNMKNGDRAVIHCKHGQSRSATVTAAFLIHEYQWTSREALIHLKACRPKVCPNVGFVEQLEVFEKLLDQKHMSSNKI